MKPRRRRRGNCRQLRENGVVVRGELEATIAGIAETAWEEADVRGSCFIDKVSACWPLPFFFTFSAKIGIQFLVPFSFFNSRFMYNCLISKFSDVLEDFEWIGCCNLYSLRRSLSFVFFFCSIKSHKSWVNFEVSKLDIYFFRLKNEETLIEEIKNKNYKPPASTLKNFSLN